MTADRRTILVCGVGRMGQGIGQVLATAGHRVRLFEPDRARAVAGCTAIEASLQRAVDRGRLADAERAEAAARLEISRTLAAGAADADLVIEAVIEDEHVKRRLFVDLDAVSPTRTVLASNTSSIPIAHLAEAVRAVRRPLVIGMHFFNPVPAMPLIEVIPGPETDPRAESLAREIAADLGKTLVLSADRPGFIVNRMLFPLLAEAMRELEEGVASPADIDAGARLGLGHPMGPLELADLIGLDVCLRILEVLADGLEPARFEPPGVLRELVAAGHLGRKSGRGFHEYEP